MEEQKKIKTAVIEELREILKISFPFCKESSPLTDKMIEINQRAHDALKAIERLGI